jgi:hypothetical protein
MEIKFLLTGNNIWSLIQKSTLLLMSKKDSIMMFKTLIKIFIILIKKKDILGVSQFRKILKNILKSNILENKLKDTRLLKESY